MRIGRFAEQAGLTTRQIRYYSDNGLVPTVKTANGYRDYDSAYIPRAKRVHCLLAAGMSMDKLWKIRACLDKGNMAMCNELHHVMQAQVDVLDERIRQLEVARDTLASKLS